ncbi:DUF3943 domain-containing protein [Mucilaginibacter agri]|uniref:DUF3943 domain-containing protein n=1 Tax=Mucilaginibacter agri TaxID=2695265 RepID=A0A966DUG7_9SPHI|nr:DUF3943 domain-containing protein [Mucilaginibacter agri]NCD72353.1 DUF3943 domain-containing protein [Mucilaginibacter agri]
MKTKTKIYLKRIPFPLLLLVLIMLTEHGANAAIFIDDTVKSIKDTSVVKVKKDTTMTTLPPVKKRFWRASGELMLAQIIPWSYNYFIRDADFAHISFKSIGHNLKPSSWEWDDNNFTTNQIGHPYQGSLYYSAFRSNGYSFWQAAPAAFAGSFMWEVAGETHNPAPNDFINTSLGGIALGEMSYRVANRIINERQHGFKRQMSEVFGFLINPMNGFNRIIDGKWGRVSTAPETDLDTANLVAEIDLGARQISEKNQDLFERGRIGWYARARVLYGDPYRESKTPFNNFDVTVELGKDDTARLNTVRVNGLLSSWEIKSNMKVEHLLSLTMNYDFYHNQAFEYGAQSVNLTVYSEYDTNEKLKFFTRAGAGVVILAAVPDAYLYYGEGRNYDYGSGVSIIANGGVSINNRWTGRLAYQGGWFETLNGSHSSYFLHAFAGEARYRIFNRVSAGAEGGAFILHGYYRDYDDINKKYPFIRLSIGVRI